MTFHHYKEMLEVMKVSKITYLKFLSAEGKS